MEYKEFDTKNNNESKRHPEQRHPMHDSQLCQMLHRDPYASNEF